MYVNLAVFVAAVLLCATDAQAYIGPGLGVGTIGVVLGLLFSVLLAVVGLFWYPIKRFFKGKKKTED